MISTKKMLFEVDWAQIRVDSARTAILAIVIMVLWCSVEDRWTVASWQTPLDYLTDTEKSDGISVLAGIRAASEGHLLPFHFISVPELGAPGVANWNDYPSTEKPLFMLMGLLACGVGIFAAANIAVMLGHVLAAVSFYTACRLLKASWIWAFAGAVIFALSRFAFSHGLHHITVAYVWHVPLCLVVIEWMMHGEGIRFNERRFVFALAVAFVAGVQNIYYTWMFIQLVAWAGLYQWWKRGWRQLLPVAAVVGTAGVSVVLMNANTIAYHFINGPNLSSVVRDYHWLEVYGFKLVDCVVPPPDHAFPPFAAWGTAHLTEVILPPGELPPSGYFGLLGLGATAWLVFRSWQRVISRALIPLEALLVLWIILYSTVGGLNGILGVLGFQLFRATTRYGIFILCIVLMYAVRRLSEIEFRIKPLPYVLAAGCILVAWLDQTPQVSDEQLSELAGQVNSDRQFTKDMERALPPGAMILQFPLMDFPESPVHGVAAYDHLRPYLYSENLRFSFGTDKGRPEAAWQHHLPQTSLNDLLVQLQSSGFQAIYVNRNAFNDKGAGVISALKSAGMTEVIDSPRGDLFCVILKKR